MKLEVYANINLHRSSQSSLHSHALFVLRALHTTSDMPTLTFSYKSVSFPSSMDYVESKYRVCVCVCVHVCLHVLQLHVAARGHLIMCLFWGELPRQVRLANQPAPGPVCLYLSVSLSGIAQNTTMPGFFFFKPWVLGNPT